jgi:flagellar protein FlaG
MKVSTMINDLVNTGFQSPRPEAKSKSPPVEEVTNALVKSSQEAAQQRQKQEAEAQKIEPSELDNAVAQLNDYVQNIQRSLSFSVEETTGQTVIQVYDSETQELIRQIPSEEALELAQAIQERQQSLLFKGQV